MRQMTKKVVATATTNEPSEQARKGKPVHYSVESIEDLPKKLAHIDLTMKMLAQNDPDYGGFKILFEDFYEEVRKALLQLILDQEDSTLADCTKRISEHVMRKLYSTIWNKDRALNPEDAIYCGKTSKLTWIEPEQIGIPEGSKTINYPMWRESAILLRKMEQARTPICKQRYLDAAIEAIGHAYSLSYPGRESEKKADQDFRISALLMVLLQTNLQHPMSTYKYMESYSYKVGEYGEDEFNRVTFHSCISFLLEVDSEGLDMTEEEFQKRVDEAKYDQVNNVHEQKSSIPTKVLEESKK